MWNHFPLYFILSRYKCSNVLLRFHWWAVEQFNSCVVCFVYAQCIHRIPCVYTLDVYVHSHWNHRWRIDAREFNTFVLHTHTRSFFFELWQRQFEVNDVENYVYYFIYLNFWRPLFCVLVLPKKTGWLERKYIVFAIVCVCLNHKIN